MVRRNAKESLLKNRQFVPYRLKHNRFLTKVSSLRYRTEDAISDVLLIPFRSLF